MISDDLARYIALTHASGPITRQDAQPPNGRNWKAEPKRPRAWAVRAPHKLSAKLERGAGS